MRKLNKHACAIALLLLTCGCQSTSTQPQLVVTECKPTPAPAAMIHGATRAQLDPAHAQRIIGITNGGDQGLIALQACQSYVRLLK